MPAAFVSISFLEENSFVSESICSGTSVKAGWRTRKAWSWRASGKLASRLGLSLQATLIGHWLDGAAKPLARVLDKLAPGEQEAFLKAMDLLETELHRPDNQS